MRLLEPFQGYKITTGNYLFHFVYLFGALHARFNVMKSNELHRWLE